MAKKKGLSRQAFLKIYFERIAYQKELFDIYSNYEKLLQRIENSISKNTEIINKIYEKY